jgi:hypothetical protein
MVLMLQRKALERSLPIVTGAPRASVDSEDVSRLNDPRWLLLIHRIPPKPGYLRVKIWRRLQGVGAVPIKNSVYVLPRSEQRREDLQWIAQEIVKSAGEAVLCEAKFVDGLTDVEIERAFIEAREADYHGVSEDAKAVLASMPEGSLAEADGQSGFEAHLVRLRRRLAQIAPIDFFEAPGRRSAETLIARIEARFKDPAPPPASAPSANVAEYQKRTWVTRRGIHVDRIACSWLIRRFVDPGASLQFVTEKTYAHAEGELRFDMFDGEFTHEGDLCSFEVFLRRFGMTDPALAAIGEIIHDVDLKESKHARPETAGFERLINGICVAHREDEARLGRGSAVLDDLYESFRRLP